MTMMEDKSTPIKHINLSLCENPDEPSSKVSLTLTNKFLRQCTAPIINEINSTLKHSQLKQSQCLETRLATASRLSSSKYKKLTGGGNKLKFDKTVRVISLSDSDLCDTLSPLTQTTPVCTPNTGVRIDNASSTHRKRLIKRIEQNTSQALEFVESFGVLPKKLICESFDGKDCTINLDHISQSAASYENMTSMKKLEVKDMLQVCDQTMISDAAYHELAMRVPELPRKSHLVACRTSMNSEYDVKRIPGMLPGSYLSIREEIVSDVKYQLEKKQPLTEPLQIKVSGDGTKVSRVSNFVNVSYSYVTETPQSHSSQRMLAIVNCDENYVNLNKSLAPLLQEINELNSAGEIRVGERNVKIEIFIGGDMKFLQLLLGLNGSLGVYACPWCKVTKEERGNVTFPEHYYHGQDIFRTVAELNSISKKKTKPHYGVKAAPLLNIELHHYIPDELHLMMRVTDVLLRNLIFDAKSKDEYSKLMGRATDNLQLLISAIQSCGVTFKTWITASGELEWTSLTGVDKKKLLNKLPEKLLFCIHEDTRDVVIDLWNKFNTLYSQACSGENADALFDNAKVFIEKFTQLGQMKREGYHPKNVTPYMHTLVYHVPYFVKNYGGLTKFSGQNVEKVNDVIKSVHQSKSNKLDPKLYMQYA